MKCGIEVSEPVGISGDSTLVQLNFWKGAFDVELVSMNWGCNSEAERMTAGFLNGINFFPNYGNGTSEERLGKVFKTLDRESIVINSKFGRLDNGVVDFGSEHIRGSVERSLKRLNVDYLDSVIIHSPPREFLDGNKNDHYAILERLQEEGKIKAYGASVDAEDEIKTLLNTTNAKVIQSFFNILHQDCVGPLRLVEDNTIFKEATVIAKIPFDGN